MSNAIKIFQQQDMFVLYIMWEKFQIFLFAFIAFPDVS